MLKTLKLTNFRKHTDLTLNFTGGLQVLRAANEGGKSTVTEGILYALYGAPLLRTPLEDTVTWGCKAASLRVELTMALQGKDYTFTRSAAGAEVTHNGTVLVTGQREVSTFAANLIGADGKAVQRLVFANQNSIRGALEEGPKAVATQIENLCDFDIFDRIIERMQEKLVMGSPSLLETRLREAEERLDATPLPTPPDRTRLENDVATAVSTVRGLEATLAEREKEAASAYATWQNADNAQRMHTTLATNLRKQEEDVRLHEAQLVAAEGKVKQAPSQSEIDGLKAQLADSEAHERKVRAYARLCSLPYPEAFWEGNRTGLEAEIERLQVSINENLSEVRATVSKINEARAKAKLLSSRIITSLTCPTCGQEVKNKEEIAAQNAALEAEVAAVLSPIGGWTDEAAGYNRAVVGLREELVELRAVVKSSTPFEEYAQTCGEFVTVDVDFVPPKLTWKGPAPSSETRAPAEIKNRLSALEELQDTARRAAGQADALRLALVDDRAAVERAREQLAQYPAVENVEDLKREHTLRTNEVIGLKAAIQQAQVQGVEAQERLTTAQRDYEQAVANRLAVKLAAEQAARDLQMLGVNNALLKKVRAIRPLVADRLWNQVLAAVGTMFSQIRGEKSVVTKEKDGFKVNGQAVEALSGSTLDALGLAIRNALTRTFLPHVPFIVLDEPASGCDEGRTTNLLGFLAAAGYEQTVLITHEDISEAFADNLITL